MLRGEAPVVADLAEIESWAREVGGELAFRIAETLLRLSAPRPPFAGLTLDRPHVMGIVNVTPDSFSDGGQHLDPTLAAAHAERLAAEGAALIDVGGESTRPGAAPVTPQEERERVGPVLRRLQALAVPRSIDTRHASVMAAAHRLGATVINDVTALSFDPDALATAAQTGAAVVLMHSRGTPDTMNQLARYDDVALDVYDALAERIEAAVAAGIPRARLAVDPGLGFAKTAEQSAALLRRLALFHGLGVALLAGASRKSFIGRLAGGEADARLGGSLAAALWAAGEGAQLLRVHDVRETVQALALWRAIAGLSPADTAR